MEKNHVVMSLEDYDALSRKAAAIDSLLNSIELEDNWRESKTVKIRLDKPTEEVFCARIARLAPEYTIEDYYLKDGLSFDVNMLKPIEVKAEEESEEI